MKRWFLVSIFTVFCIVSLVWAGSQQTSSTLGSTIVTNTRYILNESTAALWSDAELLVLVNEGIIDIQSRTLALHTSESVTLATNTLAYSLSTEYIAIAGGVYYDTTNNTYKGLKPGNLMQVGRYGAEGDPPEYYVEWKDQVLLYPLAGATTSGEQVTMYLYYRPSTITAAQNVPLLREECSADERISIRS
jgi:hypothetical protein